MKKVIVQQELEIKKEYDVIVAGGGVAGVAAAVAAARKGKRVLLIEKMVNLGGLATTGLVNFFVPMCNGRGTQIIKGMAQEFFDLSIQYGFDTVPEDWKERPPKKDTKQRYMTRYSASIFMLALTDLLVREGVELLLDSIVTNVIMDGGHAEALIVENKGGTSAYAGKMIVDATGDCDILYRAGVPTVQGGNYHTYYAFRTSLENFRTSIQKEDIAYMQSNIGGADADLYGHHQPEGKALWRGTDGEEVTRYFVECQTELLNRIRKDDRKTRDIYQLPAMPQFRTTRHIDGNYTLTTEDVYRHFPDSVGAVCDFDQRDYLYEIPYGTLVRAGYDNLITCGRSASATGYAWDIVRVIPPAIISGQAAGNACALALDSHSGITEIEIQKLQNMLEQEDVMIHFDEALVNTSVEDKRVDTGHM